MRTSCKGLNLCLRGTTALTVVAGGLALMIAGDARAADFLIADGVTAIAADAGFGPAGDVVKIESSTAFNPNTGLGANATLNTTATFSSGRIFTFANFGGRIDTDAGTTLTVTGAIFGGGGASFIKQGAGTLVFTGDGTNFAGTTRVGAGTLRIEGGGDLGSGAAAASYMSGIGGATANMVVSGIGSTWTSGGQIRVGDTGAGTMLIEAGGKVTSAQTGIIGATSTGPGTVTITGAGSEWASSGAEFYVGSFGSGTLTVAAGGTLKVGGGTGTIIVGAMAGSPASTVNIGAAEGSSAAVAGTLQANEIRLTASAGRLVFNHTEASYTFSQTISGAGAVRQIAGTTVFTGTNTYSGGTTILGGVLQVSADNNLGTGGLTIGAGTLRATTGFASSKAVTLTGAAGIEVQAGTLALSGNITDVGSLTKTGVGDLRLTGTNTYSGGTTVSAGRLIGDTDSLQGNILNNSGLDFDQTFDGTYAGVLTGTGSLRKLGTGAVIFSGDSSAYIGPTDVNAGTLRVNGALGGVINVASGATLGGNGTLGKTTIAAGGKHAPGNSIGTQTVNGDYANHGTLEIEATPLAADKVVVKGAVDITGATLDLVLTPTTPASWAALTGPYVIIDNDLADAVTGTFTPNDVNNLVFLDKLISYTGGDGNDVTLQLVRNDFDFSEVGETPNQISTGGAIDTLDNTSAVWQAVALSPTEAAARALLDTLSGEIHASLSGMFNQDSRFWRNGANDRLRSAFGGVAASGEPVMAFGALAPADTQGVALWMRGFGSWSDTDSDGNAADFERNLGGVLAGGDAALGDAARIGILAGYAHSSFDADDRDSSGDADSYQIGLYGGTQAGPIGLRAGVAYAWHDIETKRHALGDKLTADYDAGTVQVFGEAGYAIDLGGARFEPFVNAAYVSTRTDDFEEGGGPAALESEAVTNDNTFTTLGLRAAADLNLGEITATARGMAGWRHAFGDVTPESTFAFEGSDEFLIAGAPIARDAAVVEAGFDVMLSPDATLGVAYSGEFGDGAEDHGFTAELGVKF